MKPAVLIIIGVLTALGGALYLSSRRAAERTEEARPAAQAPVSTRAVRTEITFLYSTEKKAWVEEAAADFQKTHPLIRVNLVGQGSLEAARAILEGRERPTVWSPADSAVLRMLESDWATDATREPLFASEGEAAPRPLVKTPLVFVAWEDRAEVLLRASGGGAVSWKVIHDAVSSDQGWPAVGGQPEWGFVKLGHTDPTRSNSGLQALLLASLEFYGKQSGLTVADLLEPRFQTWLSQLERGTGRFEQSTGALMADMVRFGPSRYDIAVVYENLAIAQLSQPPGNWGALKVLYPTLTSWSDHPAAVLDGDWVLPRQREAALEWLRYLHSRPVQQRALAFGFRPADASVPLTPPGEASLFPRWPRGASRWTCRTARQSLMARWSATSSRCGRGGWATRGRRSPSLRPVLRHQPPRATRSMKPRIQRRFTASQASRGVGVVVSSAAV
ncbi:substrate-binding domain-containing protein [Myxococcus sp. MxC21-1]|uniref:substrate-binding domain-containing protein n=1 Tax=Myxococcus sp. MxC21-1 TaxID=3041439 RepID=UPI00292DA6BF|nr:substrate-binding domain-containing protein [Myxococcus sp. MxC21-1]WNZ60577.1 substrate-binding domain-containing protein [Myxococcus sp. MxC21-1]